MVRHTRADEEAGRLELVGSAAVGRQAPLTAALLAGRQGVGSILGTGAVLKRYFLRVGYQATIIDAYLSALMLLAALAAVAYATSAVLRLRAEETGNLAEPVLGTATGRIRWGLSHLSVAEGGACLPLATAGLSAGLGYVAGLVLQIKLRA